MDKASFRTLLEKAGKVVSITRPATAESFDVLMGTSIGTKSYELTGDVTQDGKDMTLSVVDFEGQAFTAPRNGDRISYDTTVQAIEDVKEMNGLKGILYGWRCRLVG